MASQASFQSSHSVMLKHYSTGEPCCFVLLSLNMIGKKEVFNMTESSKYQTPFGMKAKADDKIQVSQVVNVLN